MEIVGEPLLGFFGTEWRANFLANIDIAILQDLRADDAGAATPELF